MNDGTDFAPPHSLTTRESLIRPGSPNERANAGGNTVRYGMDKGMIVEFFEQPLHMEYLSKQVGHPVYRMQIMTRIVMPGNRTTIWVHATKGIKYEMLQDSDSGEYHTDWEIMESCENGDAPEPVQYPNAWAQFERKGISSNQGHPIEEWGTITRSYAESLKAQHIHTVEALASLTDQAAQSIMGAVKYRDLARAYLDERQASQILSREQERASMAGEENKQLRSQVEELKQMVMALQLKSNQSQPMSDVPRMVQGAQYVQTELPQQVRKGKVSDSKRKHQIPGPDQAA